MRTCSASRRSLAHTFARAARSTLILAALAAPGLLSAQSPWPVSIEATLGVGAGRTRGEYRSNDSGLAGDLLVGLRLRPTARGALAAAVGVGVQGAGETDLVCLPASSGGCVPSFPEFEIAAVLVGWETASTDLRVLGGPAAVRAYGDWDDIRLGLQGRVDVTRPMIGRLAVLLAGRGLVVPSYDGDSFQMISVALGLRLR